MPRRVGNSVERVLRLGHWERSVARSPLHPRYPAPRPTDSTELAGCRDLHGLAIERRPTNAASHQGVATSQAEEVVARADRKARQHAQSIRSHPTIGNCRDRRHRNLQQPCRPHASTGVIYIVTIQLSGVRRRRKRRTRPPSRRVPRTGISSAAMLIRPALGAANGLAASLSSRPLFDGRLSIRQSSRVRGPATQVPSSQMPVGR